MSAGNSMPGTKTHLTDETKQRPWQGGEMAAIVESSIEISRGPDEVFPYMADRSHDPEWIDSVVSAHREGAGPLAVGSKLQATRRIGPPTVRYTEELLELDLPGPGPTAATAACRSPSLPRVGLSRLLTAGGRA
jgi:hypothetical protein